MSYEDDVERIERVYVESDSVDKDDILEDLAEAGFDFSEGDRSELLDALQDGIASTDDVDVEPNRADRAGITTREDVEAAVASGTAGKAVGDRSDAIADAVSSRVGAPSEANLQRAQIGALTSETTTPSETIEGDSRTSQISVVRNSRGDPIATIGGGGSSGRDVSKALGAERHYRNPQEAVDDMGAQPSPDGSSAFLSLGDEVVGEVDL